MKSLLMALSIAGAVLASAQVARADLIDWADDVEAYSSMIQDYGGTIMDESTTWWLAGPPDGDDTHDFVGGWRSNAPDEYILMHWDTAIPDVPGDDLVIRRYGGPSAEANVLASVDGSTFTNIGTISGGTPLVFQEDWLDFDGQLEGNVSYVKVERVANGPKTGMFFDAFGGTAVPEPATMALLLTAAGTFGFWRRKRY